MPKTRAWLFFCFLVVSLWIHMACQPYGEAGAFLFCSSTDLRGPLSRQYFWGEETPINALHRSSLRLSLPLLIPTSLLWEATWRCLHILSTYQVSSPKPCPHRLPEQHAQDCQSSASPQRKLFFSPFAPENPGCLYGLLLTCLLNL